MKMRGTDSSEKAAPNYLTADCGRCKNAGGSAVFLRFNTVDHQYITRFQHRIALGNHHL